MKQKFRLYCFASLFCFFFASVLFFVLFYFHIFLFALFRFRIFVSLSYLSFSFFLLPQFSFRFVFRFLTFHFAYVTKAVFASFCLKIYWILFCFFRFFRFVLLLSFRFVYVIRCFAWKRNEPLCFSLKRKFGFHFASNRKRTAYPTLGPVAFSFA